MDFKLVNQLKNVDVQMKPLDALIEAIELNDEELAGVVGGDRGHHEHEHHEHHHHEHHHHEHEHHEHHHHGHHDFDVFWY